MESRASPGPATSQKAGDSAKLPPAPKLARHNAEIGKMHSDNKNNDSTTEGRRVTFVDRRRRDRRLDPDPCTHLPLDLYHRKRRKRAERRAPNRSLAEDYRAFMAAQSQAAPDDSEY